MENAIVLNDSHTRMLGKMMDLAQQRQEIIAHNLSNANTPGYVRKDIDFRQQLARILETNGREAFDAGSVEIVEDRAAPARTDGNNIQIPREMNEMMQNGVLYELLTRAFKARTSILRMAMTGAKH